MIDTISKMTGDRKCHRLIGGVLVERTVKDVLPMVQTNMDGVSINSFMDRLMELPNNYWTLIKRRKKI